jgi:nicotinamide riboside kinase
MSIQYTPIKIALLGGESTGKSTLAQALLNAVGGVLVEEFARHYWTVKRGVFTSKDMCFIALRQSRLERLAVASSNTYVICDTTPMTTLLYHRWTWPHRTVPQPIVQLAQQHSYDLTVLCNDDIPHIQDGLRDSEHFRTQQQADYRAYTEQLTTPCMTVSGSIHSRLKQVMTQLNALNLTF